MKRIGLFTIIICMMIMSACNKSAPDSSIPLDPEDSTNLQEEDLANPSEQEEVEEPLKQEETEERQISLDSEESLKDYLVGEWVSDKETLSDYVLTQSDINCNMIIDKDLNVDISFYDRISNESKGEFTGLISFDKLYANQDQVPDLITIELGEDDYPGGDFLYKHRTIYDGKRVMSLFFAGNGNCIFDYLADIDNFEYAPEEIIFEKVTQEELQFSPRKESEFYGVFWGMGEDGESLWIDEVIWTPTEEYDPEALYPTRMTIYEDDLSESSLYMIAPDKASYILENPMYDGEVYFIKTHKNGNIIDFEDAEYKKYIEEINMP